MTGDDKERLLYEAMEQYGDYLKRLVYTYVKELQKTEDIKNTTNGFLTFVNDSDRRFFRLKLGKVATTSRENSICSGPFE